MEGDNEDMDWEDSEDMDSGDSEDMDSGDSEDMERNSEDMERDCEDRGLRTMELATSLKSSDASIANFLSSTCTSLGHENACYIIHYSTGDFGRIARLIPDGAERADPVSGFALAWALLALSPVSCIRICLDLKGDWSQWMGVLASLGSNRKLRELEVHNDFTRRIDGGVLGRSLGRLLQDNPTLESLDISCPIPREMAIGLAQSVTLNQRLHTLHLRLGSLNDGSLEAVCSMACNLSALTNFHLSCLGSMEPTSVDAADGLARMLRQTSTLKKFVLSGHSARLQGEASQRILGALSESTISLEGLYLHLRDNADGEALVKLLTPQQAEGEAAGTGTGRGAGGGGIWASLKCLDFWPPAPAKATALMIRYNRTLHTLGCLPDGHWDGSNPMWSERFYLGDPHEGRYTAKEWAGSIMPALEQNTTLRHLSFEKCHGLVHGDDDEVYQSLIKMLSVNTTLETIKGLPSRWRLEGKEARVEELLRRNGAELLRTRQSLAEDRGLRTMELATSLKSSDASIANFLSSCIMDHENKFYNIHSGTGDFLRLARLIPDGAERAVPVSTYALAWALLALSPVSYISIYLDLNGDWSQWMGVLASLGSNRKLRELMVHNGWRGRIDGGVLGRSLGRLLQDNPTLESLDIRNPIPREMAIGLAQSVKLNQRLHTLHLRLGSLNDGSLERVCSMACNLSALTNFQLSCDQSLEPTSVHAVDGLACTLRQTRTAKEFGFDVASFRGEACQRILCASFDGTRSLETLSLDLDDGKALVKLLTPQQAKGEAAGTGRGAGGRGIWASLKCLHFWPPAPAKATALMIRYNRTLHTLGYIRDRDGSYPKWSVLDHFGGPHEVRYSAKEWAGSIMPALEQNTTLRHLSFENCHGLVDDDDDKVYQSLIKMLNVNTTLETIKGMPSIWSENGKEARVEELLRRNGAELLRRNRDQSGQSLAELATRLASKSSGDSKIANFLSSSTAMYHENGYWYKIDPESGDMQQISQLIPSDAHPVSMDALVWALLALSPVSNIRLVPGSTHKETEVRGILATLGSNRKLRRLKVGDGKPILNQVVAMLGSSLGHLLQDNPTLESLELEFPMESKTAIGLADNVKVNQRLHTLGLNFSSPNDGGLNAVCPMVCKLSALTNFQLMFSGRKSSQGEEMSVDAAHGLAGMLRQTRTLKEFCLGGDNLRLEGEPGRIILDALSEDGISLESLHLEFADHALGEALAKLLAQQTAGAGGGGIAASLKCLHLWPPAPAKATADMIRYNRTLHTLGYHDGATPRCNSSVVIPTSYSSEEWVHTIMPALELNTTLCHLSFRSFGLNDDDDDGDTLYQSLIKLLNVNTTLLSIIFDDDSIWRWQGKITAVEDLLRRNKEHRAALSGLPTMPVKSCRLVMCGYPYAGKTTICNGLMEERLSAHTDRTRGFEVKLMVDETNLRVAIWDLAGQQDYHALHYFVFPKVNTSSLFLFVFSQFSREECGDTKVKTVLDFKTEFTYWLRFIASNSSRTEQNTKPCVQVVVTFDDLMADKTYRAAIWDAMAQESLKKNFGKVVDILQEPLFIDSRSNACIQPLRELVIAKLQDLVGNTLPQVPRICEYTRINLQTWSSGHGAAPIISDDVFKRVFRYTCQDAIRSTTISVDQRTFLMDFAKKADSWKAVSAYLRDWGELIYFNQSKSMVIDLHWLGRGVFSQLINNFSPNSGSHEKPVLVGLNGFITKDGLRELLKISLNEVKHNEVKLGENMVTVEQLIEFMLELNLCYKNLEAGIIKGYYLPALNRINNQHLQWPPNTEDVSTFVGLRLECADQDCTFLTPGFFPRLQVFLYNYCKDKQWIDEGKQDTGVQMGVNLFGISANGLDIFVEFNGEFGCHVDILSRSNTGYGDSLTFLQQHIVSTIRSFCNSDEGCMGVRLVEGVLRQECVQQLTSCKYRTRECILTTRLMKALVDVHNEGKTYYTHTWTGVDSILAKNTEYAIQVGNHVIMVQKKYLQKALAEVQPEDCYPNMNLSLGKRRGLALVITMKKDRPGADAEQDKLEKLAHDLGFHVRLEEGKDAEVVKEVLQNIGNLPGLEADGKTVTEKERESYIWAEDECFLCFVNAHGQTSYGAQYICDDTGRYEVDDYEGLVWILRDIVKPIAKCEYLVGKPKVFVINACRGTTKLVTTPGSASSPQKKEENIVLDDVPWKTEGAEVHLLKHVSDLLLVFSTSENAKSWRHREKGSYFVNTFVETIRDLRKTTDVLSITNRVNDVLVKTPVKIKSGQEVAQVGQCSVAVSSLLKKLYWKGSPWVAADADDVLQ